MLTNIENLQSELQYLISELEKGTPKSELDLEDLNVFLKASIEAMNKYLALAPPEDVESINNALDAQASVQREAGLKSG